MWLLVKVSAELLGIKTEAQDIRKLLALWLLNNTGTSHHISCTCKMGPASDPMAVVDQHGKVHGLQNIRVVDASIMLDCIRANTHATTIMIAEKIAGSGD